MFNDDQRAHMRYLATIPPTERCWSGWCERDRDGEWKHCCAPRPCAKDLTLVDRVVLQCEVCGGYPEVDNANLQRGHLVTCTRELRRSHYASLELGEAGA
jgi:hypothetical protein